MEYLLGVNLELKNYFERKFNIIRGFLSSSSARMAPGSPNPRLTFNPRICYPLKDTHRKISAGGKRIMAQL